MSAAPRLVPDIPFPAYAFVPGQNPHPVSDPAGHSFGRAEEAVEPLDPDNWQQSRQYQYAIDLFNHGYYWEAHEAWESLWHACGRKGATADFLKGLIKLAAAAVKHRAGRPKGVASHARRAAELWRSVVTMAKPPRSVYAGLRLEDLIALAEQPYHTGWPEGPSSLPVICSQPSVSREPPRPSRSP